MTKNLRYLHVKYKQEYAVLLLGPSGVSWCLVMEVQARKVILFLVDESREVSGQSPILLDGTILKRTSLATSVVLTLARDIRSEILLPFEICVPNVTLQLSIDLVIFVVHISQVRISLKNETAHPNLPITFSFSWM